MPRISKIRIVGNKYDNFKKEHLNSCFDLCRGEEPDHTLFTMKNGSGKGVMMQLISQLVLPGTKWGNNNGNKIISMFYNQYRQFLPYTFHIVLEWKLDTIPARWLITGICVTAARLNTREEDDEERVGLQYFLYTMEHRENSRYNIENLPLFDSTQNKVIEYEVFEDFINDNKRYFRKYSKSAVSRSNSDYYQYLKSNGIYLDEWKKLKLINRQEGGAAGYFSGASDNKAVFDKKIIPAILENIYSQSENYRDTLKEIFRSNITITQKLPVLLAREKDYENLLLILEPVIEDSELGIRYYDRFNRLIDTGNNLLQGFLNYVNFLEQELKNSQIEQGKAEEEQREIEFEQANLRYARLNRRLQEMIVDKMETEKKKGQLEKEILEIENEIKRYRINELILSYDDCKNRVRIKSKERDSLCSVMNISQVEEKISELEKEIWGKWPELSGKLQEVSQDHFAFLNFIEQNKEGIKKEITALSTKIEQLAVNIKVFEKEKKDYLEWKNKLALKFNPLQLEAPQVLVEELEEKHNKIIKEIEKKDNESRENRERLEKLQRKISDKEYHEKDIHRDIEKLEELYQERLEEEEGLFKRIGTALHLDIFEEVYRPEWMKRQEREIANLIKDKEEQRLELQQELWENSIDLSLNKEDYWLANKDIVYLKDEIAKLGISVETAASFLHTLEEKEQEELLENYPLLPYALLILQEKDWEIIKGNIDSSILLHSPVPIYIRSRMNHFYQAAFETIRGKAREFVQNSEELNNWLASLTYQSEQLKESILSLDKSIETLRKLNDNIEIQLEKKTSNNLKNDIETEKEKAFELERLLLVLKEEYEERVKTAEELENTKNELEDRLRRTVEETALIREFIDKGDKLAEKETTVVQERQALDDFRKQRIDREEELDRLRQQQNDDKLNYRDWKRQVQDKLLKIRSVISDAVFREEKAVELVRTRRPVYQQIFDTEIFTLLDKRQALSNSIEEQNQQLAVVNNDIKHLEEKLSALENRLLEIDQKWSEQRIEGATAGLIENNLQKAEEILHFKEKTLNDINSQVNRLQGKIETLEEEIQESYRDIKEKYKRAALLWDDIDLLEKEIRLKKQFEENQKYLLNINDIIDNLNEKRYKIRVIISELNGYHELAEGRGEANQILLSAVKDNPKKKLDEWKNNYQDISRQLKNHIRESQFHFDDLMSNIKQALVDDALKSSVVDTLEGLRIENFRDNFESFLSMQEHFKKEINSLAEDKKKAEEAREQWASRAAKQVIKIVESLKEMVGRMVYHNENNYSFPLVRLRGSENLPREEGDIKFVLREYFLECIEEIEKSELDINNLGDRELDRYMGAEIIFSRALRGRYPVLEVYKMTEKNEFLYARPRDYNYASWEAINKGEGYDPEGSGGQTLSINTFVIMMLMNYRKRSLVNENPWTVLMLDNPFGHASAEHVLDPIFKIADNLNFQLITFAAPEIIKTEISERFPVFWALKIAGEKDEENDGVVTGRVIQGGRIRK